MDQCLVCRSTVIISVASREDDLCREEEEEGPELSVLEEESFYFLHNLLKIPLDLTTTFLRGRDDDGDSSSSFDLCDPCRLSYLTPGMKISSQIQALGKKQEDLRQAVVARMRVKLEEQDEDEDDDVGPCILPDPPTFKGQKNDKWEEIRAYVLRREATYDLEDNLGDDDDDDCPMIFPTVVMPLLPGLGFIQDDDDVGADETMETEESDHHDVKRRNRRPRRVKAQRSSKRKNKTITLSSGDAVLVNGEAQLVKKKDLAKKRKSCCSEIHPDDTTTPVRVIEEQEAVSLIVQREKEPQDHLLACQLCSKRYKSPAGLRYHMKEVHHQDFKTKQTVGNTDFEKDIIVTTDPEDSSRILYKCGICAGLYSNRYSLRGHLRDVHKGLGKCMCHACGAVLGTAWSLKFHLRHWCPLRPTPEVTARPSLKGRKWVMTCYFCGLSVEKASKERLNEHLRRHTRELPNPCPRCGRGFPHHTALKSHVRAGSCGRPEEREAFLATAREKQRRYRERFPFPCRQCSRRFRDIQSLEGHRQEQYASLTEQLQEQVLPSQDSSCH